MKQIFGILKYKILSFLKLNTTYDFITLSKSFGSSSIYALFTIGMFFFTKELLWFLVVKMKLGNFLIHEFLSIILFIFFLTVNVGNIIVSFSTMYKSPEVNYLFTKPIHSTKVFIIKFLDNFFYSSGTLFLILLSVMAGYASFYEVSIPGMIAIFIFGFIPFMLSAASLGVIILISIIIFSKKFGVKITFILISSLYLAGVTIFFNNISPVELVNNVMKYYPNVDLYFGNLIPGFIKFLPNEWLSSSLYWMLENNLLLTAGYLTLQICIAFLLLLIMGFLGHYFYKSTWLTLPGLQKENKVTRDKKYEYGKSIPLPMKDIKIFLREPSQVLHFIVLIFMVLLFVSSVKSVQVVSSQNIQLRTIISLAVYIFNIFLVSTLALRFIFPLISLEGLTFWKVRTSPLPVVKFLFRKIFFPSFIVLLISLLLTYFTARIFLSEIIFFSLIISLMISTSIILLNFSMGSLFSNFTEKNPIRIASSQGASVTFLLTVIYMTFILGVLYSPLHDYLSYVTAKTDYSEINLTTPLILISISSMLIITTSLLVLKKFMARDF